MAGRFPYSMFLLRLQNKYMTKFIYEVNNQDDMSFGLSPTSNL